MVFWGYCEPNWYPSLATLLIWRGLYLLWQSQLFKELAQKTDTGWFCIIWKHMIFAQNPTTGGSFRLSSPGRFVASSTQKGMICQWSRVGFWINCALMSTNKVMWSYCLMQSVFSPPMDLMEGISTDPARPRTAISQNWCNTWNFISIFHGNTDLQCAQQQK